MSVIQVQDLHKVYRTGWGRPVEALRGVDCDVAAGQAYGLLGPNGAGKTTLIKVLLGLVRPTRGEARLLDEPVGGTEVRARIGYMPEQPLYPDFLTARQVLHLFGRLHGLERRALRRRIDEVLAEVDLTRRADTRVRQMSKGMRQRLALAQALLTEPEVLFLDEPTEGIDPVGRVAIREILRSYRERGTTLFINSHLLTEVEMICDEVAILVDGHVARAGPLASLTLVERQYRVTVAAERSARVPAVLDGSVDALQSAEAPPGLSAWRLSVNDLAQLNAALDRLRRADVLLESVEPVRASLEEVFLREIGHAASSAGGEGGRSTGGEPGGSGGPR